MTDGPYYLMLLGIVLGAVLMFFVMPWQLAAGLIAVSAFTVGVLNAD